MKVNNLAEKRILGVDEITMLLENNKTVFIVDNAGYKKQIPQSETLNFWRDEVKIRIVEPEKADAGFELDEYSNGYCYIAIEYSNIKDIKDIASYIVLQMFH